MLVPNQMIEVKWGRTNSTHYKKLGYSFTKIGDSFYVRAEELLPNSKAIVQIKCDDCGNISSTTYQSYLTSINQHDGKYYCKSCVQKQEDVREKIEQTLYNKYGNKNIFKTDYYKNKTKQTNLNKLGVEYPTQSEVIKNKIKKSFESKGKLIGFQDRKRLLKAQLTLANNGNVLTSSQQLQLYNLLKEEYNCELNKPLYNLNLDISLLIDNTLIDIEVDGAYWHKNSIKDRRRDEFVKSNGYKVLRIKINHKLPDIKIIKESIFKLITSEHSFYQIISEDVDNNLT